VRDWVSIALAGFGAMFAVLFVGTVVTYIGDGYPDAVGRTVAIQAGLLCLAVVFAFLAVQTAAGRDTRR
jgi:hypothetical protein